MESKNIKLAEILIKLAPINGKTLSVPQWELILKKEDKKREVKKVN
jgi:hypothetical protein